MTEEFGTPSTSLEEPTGRKNTPLIVGIVALVVLCCCCVIVAGSLAWNYGDYVMQWLGVY